MVFSGETLNEVYDKYIIGQEVLIGQVVQHFKIKKLFFSKVCFFQKSQ